MTPPSTTAGSEPSPAYAVPAIVLASRVLTWLAQVDGRPPSQAEVARGLALSKSTAYNVLSTLEGLGLVQRDPSSRLYRLGAALVPLGQAAARHSRHAVLAAERLPTLAGELGLSFALFQARDDGHAQVIDRAYPTDDIHVGITLGAVNGPFDGAVGKCLLAALEPEAAAEIVEQREALPTHTERTIVKPAELLAEVATVRRQGWAASVGEYRENNAVGAPIFGSSGSAELFLVALGFSTQRLPERTPELGARLREIADAISESSGGRPVPEKQEDKDTTGPIRAQETTTP
jgi:IclR family acetate operon transcriptional repressor